MKNNDEVKKAVDFLSRGCVEIIQKEEFVEKIEQSIRLKKPLRVKAGFDPTARDLHLGHTVLLYKLKAFQELGHVVIFLIGDFTGTIGDPSGRSETRNALSKEEVLQNAETYQEQAFKILNREKTVIEFNSRWMGNMSSEALIQLSAHYSVARMLERDDFQKRYLAHQPISIHEFLYPLIQGYDSVALKADIEIGGTDQKFNLLVGRDLQRSYGLAPQVVMTMPLLEGTDGIRKMSKSYGNSIGLTESPTDMYGKVMSINDTVMWKYYELLTSEPLEELKKLHPMEAKKRLARELVSRYHGQEVSVTAATDFSGKYSQREFPEDLPALLLSEFIHETGDGFVPLVSLLVRQGVTRSNSETRRLIEQGGVEINAIRMTDPFFKLEFKKSGQEFRIKIGKKGFMRLIDA
ncbi:MAG: tyrosine--tRNA ligase [Nitrospirae bacterium]|nr:tyrosine--tRNA ligase [Nitrospirota bacterium]MBI3595290.1 tyrosine--tRNA ligase [Nitrospirota bacterium]